MGKIPIRKLNDGRTNYYALSVADSVVTSHQINVEHDLGRYKAGDKIPTATTLDSVITNVLKATSEELSSSHPYFAFEVFPTDAVIPAGTYDCKLYVLEELPEATKEIYEKYVNDIIKVENTKYRVAKEGTSTYKFVETSDVSVSELFNGLVNKHPTNLQYKVEVPASMKCAFQVRSDLSQDDSNIIIDWGDGTIQNLRELVLDAQTENGLYVTKHKDDEDAATFVFESEHWRFNLVHTYTKVGYYVVKVYGNAFFIGSRKPGTDTAPANGESIISRVFASDLPLGDQLNQPTYLCAGSFKLLKINIPRTMNFNHFYRLASTFSNCKNLQEVLVDHFANSSMNNVVWFGSVFDGCSNLKTLKMFIPPSAQEINMPFRNCPNLTCDIIYLLGKAIEMTRPEIHPAGFINYYTHFTGSFGKTDSKDTVAQWTCSNYDILAELLWDSGKKFDPKAYGWADTVKPFSGCTTLDLTKIPVAWGGTKANVSAKKESN